jgi:hypothetical protein
MFMIRAQQPLKAGAHPILRACPKVGLLRAHRFIGVDMMDTLLMSRKKIYFWTKLSRQALVLACQEDRAEADVPVASRAAGPSPAQQLFPECPLADNQVPRKN